MCINKSAYPEMVMVAYSGFLVDFSSGGSKGGARDARPPRGPNSFNFMQFLRNFGKIICWRPPWELAPPPRGNPGSATVFDIAIRKVLT